MSDLVEPFLALFQYKSDELCNSPFLDVDVCPTCTLVLVGTFMDIH